MGSLNCNCTKKELVNEEVNMVIKDDPSSRNKKLYAKKNQSETYDQSYFTSKSNSKQVDDEVHQALQELCLQMPTNHITTVNNHEATASQQVYTYTNTNTKKHKEVVKEVNIKEEIENYFIINLVRKIQKAVKAFLLYKKRKLIGLNNENLQMSFISSNNYSSNIRTKSKKDLALKTVGNIQLIKAESSLKQSINRDINNTPTNKCFLLNEFNRENDKRKYDSSQYQYRTQPNLTYNIDEKLIDEIHDDVEYIGNRDIDNNKSGFGVVIWNDTGDNLCSSQDLYTKVNSTKRRKDINYNYNTYTTANNNSTSINQPKRIKVTKLIGIFNKNKISGFAKFIKKDGCFFNGELINNTANGFGIFCNSKGITYEGDWVNDSQHGYGIEISSDGSFYKGQFDYGLKSGIGEYNWKDGSNYQGQWVANSMHGYGIYSSADGKLYKGEFVNSSMHGFGLLTITENEKYYYGSFEKDKKEGLGAFIWLKPYFKAYIGFWSKSKQHGVGKLISVKTEAESNTEVVSEKYGLWKEGERVKWIKTYEEAMSYIKFNKQEYGRILTSNWNSLSFIKMVKDM